ncbi:MAG TPA: hypothetical protein VNX65_01380 [Patescibacteria group bacterium]|nr:hypothetical protein [Patescibacteria group bacterium]
MSLVDIVITGEYFYEEPRKFELGRIVPNLGAGLTPQELGISETIAPLEILKPHIIDPHVEHLRRHNPGRLEEIAAAEALMNAYAEQRRIDGSWNLEPGTPYVDLNGETLRSTSWGDPVSRERFLGPERILDKSVQIWATNIPGAGALVPLSDPTYAQTITGLDENRQPTTVEMTDTAREWMTGCTDALGIRNRNTILAEETRALIDTYAVSHPDEQILMVSVAAGTLLPTLQAAINSGHDHRIRIVMLENNPSSIEMAHGFAEELGFQGVLDIRKVDVFDPTSMEEQLGELEGKALSVDAEGIFEYVNEGLHKKLGGRFAPGYMLFDPITFFSTINRFTREEGQLNIGQMRDDRPNSDFTRGVIGWPYIVQRSPEELMQIMIAGGADPKDVRLIVTPDGVYTMASIRKPGGEPAPSSDTGTRSRRHLRIVEETINVALL